MESSWEAWFASLAKKYDENSIKKFSSLSMSANQASLMLGPILAAFLFKRMQDLSYFFVPYFLPFVPLLAFLYL